MSSVLEHSIVSDQVRPGRAVRAAIYVRISSDRTGAGLGVARQEEDCRALCAARGWDVVRVYPDNDVSAYSGKPRPQWSQLLSDIAAGMVDAVACWHVDRLTRSPRELEEVIDLHDKSGILLATVTGEIDLLTPTGRMLARMLGAAARHEAEHKAERQRRAGLQKAKAGKVHRSGTRGYGYEPDGVTVVAAEAEIIREAATRALAGESMRSIAGDLNDRAVPTVTGKQWSAAVLRQVLTSGRISGRREYHGEIMAEQSWSPVITPKESDQLRAQLATRPGTPRGRARSYLFSGIFTCGNCQAGMSGRPHSAGLRYVCVKAPGKSGCGKVAVLAAPAEQIARDKILTALDSPEFIAALIAATATAGDAEPGQVTDQLRDIDTQRAELAEDWAARRITRKEWLAARDQLTATADSLTARLSRSEHSRALVAFAAMTGTVWDRWEQMTHGARRALVKATTAGIPVHAAASRRWNPARIGAPLWRA